MVRLGMLVLDFISTFYTIHEFYLVKDLAIYVMF